jgi:hypothetical protein
MNEYTDYQSCTDEELVELFLSGDMNASYFLVMVRYQKTLHGLIYRLKKCSNDDLESWLWLIYKDVTTLTLIEAKNKFESIKDKNKVEGWLRQCATSFLCKSPVTINTDFEDFADDSDSDSEIGFYEQLLLIPGLIPKIIEYFKDLSSRNLYIVLTYLFYENGDKKIYNIDERIAEILKYYGFKISRNAVKTVKCRALQEAGIYFQEYLKNISES